MVRRLDSRLRGNDVIFAKTPGDEESRSASKTNQSEIPGFAQKDAGRVFGASSARRGVADFMSFSGSAFPSLAPAKSSDFALFKLSFALICAKNAQSLHHSKK